MERLLKMALRFAESKYTRSEERAKWTRLADQPLWYKDQILRAMTWEALDQDYDRLRGKCTINEKRNRRHVSSALSQLRLSRPS